VTLRLRLSAIAVLVTLLALGLHLLGARPAAAAGSKPTHRSKPLRHSTTASHSKPAHRLPARERSRRPGPARSRPRLTKTSTAKHGRAGGLILAVRHRGQTAHAAADPSASIVDFSFSPSSITIHVGDTITWTNVGHQPHSATANDHSFDTGILQHGQSGSHTFTTPGTYTYFCIVHPNMKGTVVVLANATANTTTTSTTTTTTTTPTATSTSGLPNTGLDIAGVVLSGTALTGLGFALRRRLS
jgi:plastocyanin